MQSNVIQLTTYNKILPSNELLIKNNLEHKLHIFEMVILMPIYQMSLY